MTWYTYDLDSPGLMVLTRYTYDMTKLDQGRIAPIWYTHDIFEEDESPGC